MPDLPISGLPVVTALSSSYLIPAVSGSVTAQMTLAQVGAAISGSYVTVDGTQTIAGSKTFSANQLILAPASSGGVLNLKQDAYLGSTNGYTSLASDGTNIAIIAANGAITNKQAVLDLSSLTNNTLRTYTFPNLTGTIALLEGTQTFTGSKTFSGDSLFTNIAMFDWNANFKVGGPLVGTGDYVALGFDKTGSGAGSTLSMELADGTSAKNIILNFVGSPATYTYNFPAKDGTVAMLSDITSSGTAFPYTGSAVISGSLNVIGSTNISGSFTVTGSIIGNVSASGQVIGGVLGRFNNVLIYSTLAGTGTGSIKITTGNAISVDGGSWNTVLGAGAYFGADPNTPGTGSRNTAIGVSASYNNFIGQDNVAIGYQALANNTGSQNIAIGNGALYNTLGDPYGYYGNIAIGYSASYSHKAGSSNVAVGNYELSSLTTGSWNIAVGGGSYVTQGDYNVSLGGLGPVSGSWNTAINSAGGNLVTGSGNTFVGNIAGFNHVYGYYNTALGYGAMFKQHTIYLLTPPTQSSYNIAVGYQSMYSQEGGFHNVAIGSSALNGSSSFSQNTGSYNVAIGYSASYNNTIGIRNTTIGYSAGSSITTGNYNTILGSTTGSTTLTGTVLIADGQGNLAMKATGSAVTLYNVLQLPTQHPLPAASSYPNSFAVSASSPTKPYYSDGTNWNALY